MRIDLGVGVDPGTRRCMLKYIEDKLTGRTVLLTTHPMDEAETPGNRIGIIAPWKRVLNIFLDLYHVALFLLLFLKMTFK